MSVRRLLIGLAVPCLGPGTARPSRPISPGFRPRRSTRTPARSCYAVTVADVDGNRKPDVVAVTEDAVVWYENPGWRGTT